MKRLKAFTVLELLVAMVISSMVIGASYFTYDIIYKQFLNYKQVDRNVLDALTFRNVLNYDFATGEFIYKMNDGISITKFDGTERQYAFSNGTIIRSAGSVKDTFYLNCSDWKYHELEITSVFQPLLTKLEIILAINDEPGEMSFTKQYAADLLMRVENGKW